MLETKGRAVIVKDFDADFKKSQSCNACSRTTDLKRVLIKRGRYVDELCYCQSCWNQIFNYIYKEDNYE